MVIKLAPVSLSNKKVNFYTCPRVTLPRKKILSIAFFKYFWRGWGVGGGGGDACSHTL